MKEALSPLQKIKLELSEKYKGLLNQVPAYMKCSMMIAYERGLNDAFNWIKDYNEKNQQTLEEKR